MGLGKLLRVERTINIYTASQSETLGEIQHEINIDILDLETLKKIVTPNIDDPLVYDGYPLTWEQIESLNVFIDQKINPDFTLFEYYLECYGIYET